MPITLICPRLRCKTVLRVPDSVRGKRVRCSECGTVFHVPAAGAAPTPASHPADNEKPSDKH